eukprot:SAG31_NODE_1875_length_7019_cov_39.090896_7_plen_89_part_00
MRSFTSVLCCFSDGQDIAAPVLAQVNKADTENVTQAFTLSRDGSRLFMRYGGAYIAKSFDVFICRPLMELTCSKKVGKLSDQPICRDI